MVLRNDDLNLVSWEQRVTEGQPRAGISQFVPPFPYADYAQLLGLIGVRVDAPESVGAAWDAALAADRPVLLEMITDPNVPPAPPHLTGEQTRAYASALLRGDRDGLATVIAAAREWWSGLFPAESDEPDPPAGPARSSAPGPARPPGPSAVAVTVPSESAAGEEDPGAALDDTRGGSST
jgi:hypothetical protein